MTEKKNAYVEARPTQFLPKLKARRSLYVWHLEANQPPESSRATTLMRASTMIVFFG